MPRSFPGPSGAQREGLPGCEPERIGEHRGPAAPSGRAGRRAPRATDRPPPRPPARARPHARDRLACRGRSSPGRSRSRRSTRPRTNAGVLVAGPSVHISFVRAREEAVWRCLMRRCRPRHRCRRPGAPRLATAAASSSARLRRPAGGSDSVAGTVRRSANSARSIHPSGSSSGGGRGLGHLGEVERPRARHDPRPLVAAAPGRDPSASGGLVGELVKHGGGLAVGVRREPRCASGSLAWVSHPSWVTSTSGAKARTSGGTAVRNASSHPSSPVPGGRGRFTAEPGASGPPRSDEPAGAGEEADLGRVLVDRDRQHPRVVPEDRLHAVAMVYVHVDVGDPLDASGEHPGDRDGRIVVHAEPRRARRHRMVQAAGRVERMRGLADDHRPGGRDGGARHDRPGLVHAVEDRVVARAVAEPAPGSVYPVPGLPGRLDELRRVHQEQRLVVGRRCARSGSRPALDPCRNRR